MSITVNDVVKPLRWLTQNPAGAAVLVGLTTWGGSKLFYPQLKKAINHITTLPGRKANPEIPDAYKTPEELEQDRKDERNIPLILGGLGLAGTLALSYSNAKGLPFGGLFSSWDDPRRYNAPDNDTGLETQNTGSGITKKEYDMSWDINDQTTMDFGKLIPVRMATDIIMNDPYTEIYHKGNALSVINDASRNGQDNKMTAGSLFDSALNKVQKNLTVQGVSNAALRGTIGYGVAKAFTNAIGTITDMPKGIQDAIVSAGMVTNIIQGLY